MILYLLLLIAGFALLALTSYLFWRIGKEDGISPRWRNAPGMEGIWVLIILGGWAAGGSLVIKSLAFCFFG
jgi:hypothetical protein